jgi:hypothetical protein
MFMPLENFAEPEVAVAAVVVGTAASPKLRNVVRRSAVYGLAGALIAYDKTAAVAQGLFKGIRNGVNSITPAAESEAPSPAPAPASAEAAAPQPSHQ